MTLDQDIERIRLEQHRNDWISPKTEIRKSIIGGNGLFATEKIKKDELVVVWCGEYVDKNTAEEKKKDGFLIMQWDENLFSMEKRGEDSGYFINHSCDPNLWLHGTYSLTARKDIDKGEELTADYATWEADENYRSQWNCNCNSPHCRHVITGNDWKDSSLQTRYEHHFSPLLNKRITQNLS